MQQVLARLADAQDQIAYLRAKLDRAGEELAAERAKVTALLTDQRPGQQQPAAPARRSWWRWR